MPNLGAFISYVMITTFTPGPNNIMSMSNAVKYGYRKSVSFTLGIFSGFIIIMLLCAAFSATLFNLMPSIKPYMTYVGAAYILWLSWKIFRSKPHGEGDEKKGENTFLAGFMLQFVNPKVILYGITTVSTFILPNYNSLPLIGVSAFILAFVAFISVNCWALFGSGFNFIFDRHYKMVNTALSLLLVYCAVSLFH
jgi:threonine/homoserine/homoserine lactone efflux protein